DHFPCGNAIQSPCGSNPHITRGILDEALDAIARQAIAGRVTLLQLAIVILSHAVEQRANPQFSGAVLVDRAASGRTLGSVDEAVCLPPKTVPVVSSE